MVDLPRDEEGRPDLEAVGATAARYGLEVDPSSIPGLLADHGLHFDPFGR